VSGVEVPFKEKIFYPTVVLTCVSLLRGLLRYSGGKSLSDDALSVFFVPSSLFLKGKNTADMMSKAWEWLYQSQRSIPGTKYNVIECHFPIL